MTPLSDTISQLRREIILRENLKHPSVAHTKILYGNMAAAFPKGDLPMGTVHEMITTTTADHAATMAFTWALINRIMQPDAIAVCIGRSEIFPHTLSSFGVNPDNVLFVRVSKDKQILQAAEMVLQSEAIASLITEITELSFTESRRLQLATERSGTTAFLLRQNPKNLSTASVSRWCIRSAPSEPGELPGIGNTVWDVELLRVRNGKPGKWTIEYVDHQFNYITEQPAIIHQPLRKIV